MRERSGKVSLFSHKNQKFLPPIIYKAKNFENQMYTWFLLEVEECVSTDLASSQLCNTQLQHLRKLANASFQFSVLASQRISAEKVETANMLQKKKRENNFARGGILEKELCFMCTVSVKLLI